MFDMNDKKLAGVFAPISTPFTVEGKVDYEELEKNMGVYAKSGIKGYLALGSNGENKSLTNDEKLDILKMIIDNKASEQVVMAGCIFESTAETIDMGKKMTHLGADFLTLLPPSYFKKQMTDDVLCKYFSDVADSVDIPCLVYNAPQYAGGVVLSVGLLKRCASHKNIAGVKDSSTGNIESILFALRDKFSVMAGSINNFFQAMTMGGVGGVLSLANSFPGICVELYSMLAEKKFAEAIELNDKALRLNKAISGRGGVASVKYAMDLAGLAGGVPRLPLLPLDDEEKTAMRKNLRSFGVIE
jgi:4-hydroxy-2-oxoglutarate aldolase